jgi:N-acetylmuramoyl-L-alanine amidase
MKRTLISLLLAAIGCAAMAAVPQEFDPRWTPTRPRTPEGIYPNLGSDWQALPNFRYEVSSGQPLAGLHICIDAGHGGQIWGPAHGYTAGTRGVNTGLSESEANLRTALFLWDLLTQAGADVTMTRVREDRLTPTPTSGDGRVEELHIRDTMAEQASCDYFIAIHHNAPGGNQPNLNYTAVYYFDTAHYDAEYNADPQYVQRHPDPELNAERVSLAEAVQRGLSTRLGLPVIPISAGGENDMGHEVPHGDYHVIREIGIPAILVESSFMTNPGEDLRLNDPARAKQEAIGIFEGLLAHFQDHPIQRWSARAPAQ